MRRYIIWDSNPDFENWAEDLRAEYPDLSEDELRDEMYFLMEHYLEDERMNLDINLPQRIIAIADLELWNGHRCGYKELGYNLSECLSVCSGDIQEYYVNESGDVCGKDAHHDGTNHYLFRAYRQNTSEKQIEDLKDKIYNGTVCWDDIVKVTRRIGDYAASVYGWKLVGGIHI